LVFEPQRGECGANVVVHLAGRALAVEGPEDALLLVVLDQRARLLVEDLEPVLHGLRLVVLALLEPGPVLVADALALRRVELDVVEVAVLDAHPTAREAADDLVVVHVDQQRGGEAAAGLVERLPDHLAATRAPGAGPQKPSAGRRVAHARPSNPPGCPPDPASPAGLAHLRVKHLSPAMRG